MVSSPGVNSTRLDAANRWMPVSQRRHSRRLARASRQGQRSPPIDRPVRGTRSSVLAVGTCSAHQAAEVLVQSPPRRRRAAGTEPPGQPGIGVVGAVPQAGIGWGRVAVLISSVAGADAPQWAPKSSSGKAGYGDPDRRGPGAARTGSGGVQSPGAEYAAHRGRR